MEMTMKAKVDSSGKTKAFLSVVIAEISEFFLSLQSLQSYSQKAASLFLSALLKC